ncbi:alpha/beta hydrolase [Nitrincola alkalisediminis]|uniref:alpha/beta fold hydrolase n=1 Tax=Nitrincola alkalisediminis TaxID=1366656 RepID=UPI001876F9C7|nr:alpha/beta fold hydrolase [Nitrincola alkalisediminis]
MRKTSPFKKFKYRLLLWSLVLLAPFFTWVFWSETHPSTEREVRLQMHEWLEVQFPEQMSLEDGWHGMHTKHTTDALQPIGVVLIHGLDEPGNIWQDLLPQLQALDLNVWEFHYPNDHAVDMSANYLAEQWPSLPKDVDLVLIGHSMGGLVAREFVSKHRHPVSETELVDGASVKSIILIGTPNNGSEWARMRGFLELRDHLTLNNERHLDAFSGLRDGTGAAKLDLRPGSEFLETLNQRAWPSQVETHVIAGKLLDLDDMIGDGVVPLDSALLPDGAASEVVLDASHRGLLVRLMPSQDTPPAIPIILEHLKHLIDAGA